MNPDTTRFESVLRFALGLGAAYHFACVVLFAALDVWGLALYDTGITALYATLFVLVRRGALYFALSVYIVEHNLHALLATPVFGWSMGFQYLALFGVVGVSVAPSGRRVFKGLVYALCFASFCGIYYYGESVTPSWSGDPLVAQIVNLVNVAVFVAGIATSVLFFRGLAERSEAALRHEHERSEDLLHNILPVQIAHRLKDGRDAIAERFEHATILFADLVGFTRLAEKLDAPVLVALLNELFSRFDDLAQELGLEKIKTIGDCYMVAAGVPEPRDDHAEVTVRFAQGMTRALAAVVADSGHDLQLRIGVNSGRVVAGVIGKTKFVYDLWGDHVNTASRMESHGIAGRIHVSESTWALTRDAFNYEARGEIDVKGKGSMSTYLLTD